MSRGIPWLRDPTEPKLAIHCGGTTSCQELLELPLQLILVLGLTVPLFTEEETETQVFAHPHPGILSWTVTAHRV